MIRLMRLYVIVTVIAISLILSSCTINDNNANSSSTVSSNTDSSNTDSSSIDNGQNKRFETIGLYVWDDNPGQHSYWKACGINTLVFCDRGWWYNANTNLDEYLNKLTTWVNSAKENGFIVYMILFSNIEQYKGPEANEPSGLGIKFHPNDDEKLEERLYYLQKTIEASKDADGFTLFAGDPGGISNAMGEGGSAPFIKMAYRVRDLVKEHAPNALFNINTWAISYWQTPNISTGNPQFWLNETIMTQEIIDAEGLIDEYAGIELPTHDYYRPLALRPYSSMIKSGAVDDFPLFPLKSDIDKLKERGVKRIWSWPYFLMDEADDGDPGGGRKTTFPQMETRYIFDHMIKMQEIGMNGIIGNWSFSGYQNKSLNTYAFGRFANDDKATIDDVYNEFANFVATSETAPVLIEILKFIENDSNWQKKLPEAKRLDNLETTIIDTQDALNKLELVELNTEPEVLIPGGGERYLRLIKARLEWMLY